MRTQLKLFDETPILAARINVGHFVREDFEYIAHDIIS